MEHSLTVLLPVHNAQATLAHTVAETLEVVSELTARFELMIIDDGSADATSELASELTQRYPQVRAVFHGRRQGREAALRSGLQHSSGEIIFVRDEVSGLTLDEIPRLWRSAMRTGAGPGQPTPAAAKLSRFSTAHGAGPGACKMIDRPTLEQMHARSQPGRPNYLAKTGDFVLEE